MVVSIRVMWDSEEERELALKLLSLIKSCLKSGGIRFSTSGTYRNRKGTGGRIYVRVYGGSHNMY